VKLFALLGLLLFATTATAGELCVNYVSGVHLKPRWGCDGGKCAFMSFNPQSRANLVVATTDSVPAGVTWDKGVGSLTYSRKHRLQWKIGAAPTTLPPKDRHGPLPSTLPSQTLGKIWVISSPSPTFDTPANRKIDVGYTGGGCVEHNFSAPVTWTNTETGETKILYGRNLSTGFSVVLQISTADDLILIAQMYSGADAIVADMGTGEVLLRAGDHSRAATWGKCPSK
jgi:hypothetical protein